MSSSPTRTHKDMSLTLLDAGGEEEEIKDEDETGELRRELWTLAEARRSPCSLETDAAAARWNMEDRSAASAWEASPPGFCGPLGWVPNSNVGMGATWL